jgi:hypothetical protein
VTPCSFVDVCHCFGETCRLHLRGRRTRLVGMYFIRCRQKGCEPGETVVLLYQSVRHHVNVVVTQTLGTWYSADCYRAREVTREGNCHPLPCPGSAGRQRASRLERRDTSSRYLPPRFHHDFSFSAFFLFRLLSHFRLYASIRQ